MDEETKEKWVDALRSDKYKQNRGSLRDGDTFCCLGVLCDLANVGEWDGERYVTPESPGSYSILPDAVMDWAGIEVTDERGRRIGGVAIADGPHLAAYNDGDASNGIEPHNFDEIADLIEQNL